MFQYFHQRGSSNLAIIFKSKIELKKPSLYLDILAKSDIPDKWHWIANAEL